VNASPGVRALVRRDANTRSPVLAIDRRGEMVMSLNKDESVTFDLNESRRAKEALEASRAGEERLHLTLEAAGLGHWDFDFASGALVWSDQIRKLLGVKVGVPASRALLLSLVHDDDRLRFEEHLTRSAHPDCDRGRHLEFRILMDGGSARWLEDQSRGASPRRRRRTRYHRTQECRRDAGPS
jgi:PAS domain-containing protein